MSEWEFIDPKGDNERQKPQASHPLISFFDYVDQREWLRILLGLTIVLTVGISVGFSTNLESDLKHEITWARVNNVLGWTYFAAWSLSFYPQMTLNFVRRSVVGMSFDYQIYNIIGYTCYAIFNGLFYWDSKIQSEYAAKHHGHRNQIQVSDVFFAIHGDAITIILLFQIAFFERGNQFISWFCRILSVLCVLVGGVYSIVTCFVSSSFFNWLNVLECLSDIKLAVTFVKYIPQIWLNYKRKSTDGLNIDNFLLDFLGGVLSIAQLFLDCSLTHDWSSIEGDVAKFGLGVIAILFDTIIIIQHYILYRQSKVSLESVTETAPLLQ